MERGNRIVERVAAKQTDQQFALTALEQVLVDRKEVALRSDGNEAESELYRRRLDAESRVGEAARDVRGDRGVGVLLGLVALDASRVDAGVGEQLVEKQPRSRVALAVDESHPWLRQVPD